MAKTSGMQISVTDEERAKINKLQELLGISRKAVIMSLVNERLAKMKAKK